MHWNTADTICAIASGSSGAERGILRVSGPEVLEIVQKLLPTSAPILNQLRSARRIPLDIPLGENWRSIPCDLWVWPTQQSYVGQPTVEIHCIGSIPILERLIGMLCLHGARMAEPGEFTLRAFLAGRLDLAQCEAVLGVVHASSKKGLSIALEQLSGGLQLPIQDLRTDLVHLLADLEAGLDFVDENIEFVSREDVIRRIENAKSDIDELLDQLNSRSLHQQTPRVVLVGLPNSGKSSLLNALLHREIAIVSEQAGTTRDYIRVLDERGKLELVDTAGIETLNENTPRGLAQHFTSQQSEQADLRLYCIDLSASEEEIRQSLEGGVREVGELAKVETWWIGTKLDLASLSYLEVMNSILESSHSFPIKNFMLSSRTQQGVDELRQGIAEWQIDRCETSASIVPSTLVRCTTALRASTEALDAARIAAVEEAGDELIASELRLGLHQLGVVAGEVYTDDILDALFSRFCIGK